MPLFWVCQSFLNPIMFICSLKIPRSVQQPVQLLLWWVGMGNECGFPEGLSFPHRCASFAVLSTPPCRLFAPWWTEWVWAQWFRCSSLEMGISSSFLRANLSRNLRYAARRPPSHQHHTNIFNSWLWLSDLFSPVCFCAIMCPLVVFSSTCVCLCVCVQFDKDLRHPLVLEQPALLAAVSSWHSDFELQEIFRKGSSRSAHPRHPTWSPTALLILCPSLPSLPPLPP